MDYSDFDYVKALDLYDTKELEIMLFKSRMSYTCAVAKELWKKQKVKDLIFGIIMAGIVSSFFIVSFFYALINGLVYYLTHRNNKTFTFRYKGIKWSQKDINQILYNDGYTTLGDISEVAKCAEIAEEKIIEECPQKNPVEDIYEDKNAEEIIKDHEENAQRELKMALQMDNDDFKKYLYCGRAYCCIGNYKEAIENLETACKMNNNDAWSFCWCGKAYYELKDYKSAIKKLERACELDNNQHEFFYECGKAYYELKDYNNAIKKLERACELDDSDFWCFHLCGEVYLKIGENEKAFEKFDRNVQV